MLISIVIRADKNKLKELECASLVAFLLVNILQNLVPCSYMELNQLIN